MKICNKCKIEKSNNSFYKNSFRKKGLRYICKSCHKQICKKRYSSRHPEFIKKKLLNKQLFDKGLKICTKCKKELSIDQFYNSNKSRNILSYRCKKCIREVLKSYQSNHKQEIKVKAKIYREIHKLRIKKSQNKYIKTHKDKIKEYKKKYVIFRYKHDIRFKLSYLLRCRLRLALKGICKSKSTIKLLGCSIKFLKNHLESKFTKGMTWENHGSYGWHIDHIRPCASFDLNKPSEQRKCFHYTNLQPLWAKDNLEKYDKIIQEKYYVGN